MAESPEIEAAIIKVAGEWAKYLDTFKPGYRKAALGRLLKRYEAIYEHLELIHEAHS